MPKIYKLTLIFLLFSPILSAESPYFMSETESVLPFREVGKLVVVEATVNDVQGYFLFDTGIGVLTLNERFFQEEENLPKFRKVTDINGSREKLGGGFVGAFRWGGLQRDSFHAPLMDLTSLEKIMNIELVGLLGWEVFQEVEIFIDYDARQLTLRQLDDLGEPSGPHFWNTPDHILPFEMELHMPVLQAQIGELPLRMGWDSGASINMMNKKFGESLPDETRVLMEIPYGGVFSEKKAPFVACDAIYVDGQFAVTAWRMALSKMRHFEKRDIEIDGLIGADLLRLGKLSINYQKKEIAVWVDDNVFSLRYQPIGDAGWAKKNDDGENNGTTGNER